MKSINKQGRILEALRKIDASSVQAIVQTMHAVDLADMLEAMNAEERRKFVLLCGDAFDFLVLTEVGEVIRSEMLGYFEREKIASAVLALETDDAVSILGCMSRGEREKVMSRLPVAERAALSRGLNYPKKTAGRLMQTELISAPPSWTVGRMIDYMREAEDLPEDFYEIFIVDSSCKPIGTVALGRLLRTQRPVQLSVIMDKDIHGLGALLDQEEVARIFERYDLVSAAVTDEAGKLVGVITVDDIIDVIEEEADEDIRHLSGVGEVSESLVNTVRGRFVWLFVNLVTAILASWVISLFDRTLERMIALAVLMPIVASMGGNAGTQTMTVVVRAIAISGLARFSTGRVMWREVIAALLNGCMFALIVGSISALWFSSVQLGIVIGCAVTVNFLVAGLSGILVPVGLQRANFDPAVASGVFVTMITDVVGFLVFLGLAAMWLGPT